MQIALVEYKIYISVTTKMEVIILFVEASSVASRLLLLNATLHYLSGGEQVHGGIQSFQCSC